MTDPLNLVQEQFDRVGAVYRSTIVENKLHIQNTLKMSAEDQINQDEAMKVVNLILGLFLLTLICSSAYVWKQYIDFSNFAGKPIGLASVGLPLVKTWYQCSTVVFSSFSVSRSAKSSVVFHSIQTMKSYCSLKPPLKNWVWTFKAHQISNFVWEASNAAHNFFRAL